MEANAERLQSTCRGILMPELPTERFCEMVKKVVKLNERFIPPYESGASLYIRPLLIGTSAQVGVHPASEYLFVIFVTPVGPYFKGGFATNPYVIIREFDRAAPLGTGTFKVGGNYAAQLACEQDGTRPGLFLRVLPRRKREEVHRRVWRRQLLRYQEQYLYHSAVNVHPSVHHQPQPDAVGRGYGAEGGTSSGA